LQFAPVTFTVMKFWFVLLLLCAGTHLCAQNRVLERLRGPVGRVFFEETGPQQFEWKGDADTVSATNHRGVAVALAITLGVFGMHRIYLGTTPLVPAFYTVTIGGGMVLWLVDTGLLIFTKDISRFYNQPGIFMWTEKDARP
jgi:TM2 domain-containing membrane protein YozV